VLAVMVLLTTACGGHKSVLDEGIRPGVSGKTHVIGVAEARKAAGTTSAVWKRELRLQARRNPGVRFENFAAGALRSRLDAAAARYGFDVVSFELLHPRQLAPKIVVRTSRYLELARATNAILTQFDGRPHWRYEGLYFRAEDEHGVPFLIAYDVVRGESMGGQWARSERLYPFQHG
jgi:hypothetical protein